MPEDKKEIELKEGESKEIKIDIPLAVQGDDKPEVKPKEDSIRDEQDDEQENDSEANEQDGEQENDSGQENSDQSEGNQTENENNQSMSPIGEMNKLPSRRENSKNQDLENIKKGAENKSNKNNDPNQDSNLSPVGQMNKRKKPDSDMENLSPREKATERAGRIGDKLLPKPSASEKKKKQKEAENDEMTEPSKRQNLRSSWNKLRNSVRNKDNKSDINQKRSATGVVINRGSRLASFEFYRLCWLNLISSYGLTYFGLLFLFIAKYVAHSDKIVKFVTIKDESVRLEIIKHKEKASILMIIGFLLLSFLVGVVFCVAILLIIMILKAMGIIPITLEDLKFIWKAIKALL